MQLSNIVAKPLLVASNEVNFGLHSGYSIISQYISGCNTIFINRNKYKRLDERIINKLLRNFSISRWYQLSSAHLEWLIWRKIQNGNYAPVHFLWGERDLGFVDFFINPNILPLCSTFHACSDDLPKIIPLSSRKRLKNLAAIFIVSETQRIFFEECGVDSNKIHFIPHGIDTNFFIPHNKANINQPFTVISVGSYRRNFIFLRKVFNELNQFKNIHIKVISSENNRKYFFDLGNVEFISNIKDADLLLAYQSASCQIISVDNATANNALLEGLACGLPVVAEKVGGIPEYVNKDCAILTNAGDIKSTVEAIVELSQSPSKCFNMAISAREKALELSWCNIAQKMEKKYTSIVHYFK